MDDPIHSVALVVGLAEFTVIEEFYHCFMDVYVVLAVGLALSEGLSTLCDRGQMVSGSTY